jgi:hypothetical protein
MIVGSYPPGAGTGAGTAAEPELMGRMMVASLSSESLEGFIVQAWGDARLRASRLLSVAQRRSVPVSGVQTVPGN